MSILLEDPGEYPDHVAVGTADSFVNHPGVDWSEVTDYALFSGGYDSLVSVWEMMEEGPAEAVLHLDTTTGIPENEAWIISLCEEMGWPLRIERAPITLYEFATGANSDRDAYGLPGPGAHLWAYSWFKEKGIRRVAKQCDSKPTCYTGIRKHESGKRKVNASEGLDGTEMWRWKNPIQDYREHQIQDALDDLGITNPVVEALGRSGECWCCAYGNRDQAVIDLKAGGYGEHWERLLEMEGQIQEEIGTEEDYAYICHGDASSNTLKSLKASNREGQMRLCQGCKVDYPTPGDDEAPDWGGD